MATVISNTVILVSGSNLSSNYLWFESSTRSCFFRNVMADLTKMFYTRSYVLSIWLEMCTNELGELITSRHLEMTQANDIPVHSQSSAAYLVIYFIKAENQYLLSYKLPQLRIGVVGSFLVCHCDRIASSYPENFVPAKKMAFSKKNSQEIHARGFKNKYYFCFDHCVHEYVSNPTGGKNHTSSNYLVKS